MTRRVEAVNVLWIFAHPDQASLNGSLRDEGIAELAADGHRVQLSDLYAMKWKSTVDSDDFADEGLSADIVEEQEKLSWADAVVVQFPLWWYGMPAILKGWFDRVFVKGYAYGVRDPREPRRSLRYGEGKLAGKRALVVVTSGSPEAPLGPRGINGQLDEVLFPLLHGTLWYTGMPVLPPVAVYGADRIDADGYRAAAALVRERVAAIGCTEPIAFRYQNTGDYDESLVLRPELAPGGSGLGVHRAGPGTSRPEPGQAGRGDGYRPDPGSAHRRKQR
jgi:NAD(P)H dehydrogenase (quinone)